MGCSGEHHWCQDNVASVTLDRHMASTDGVDRAVQLIDLLGDRTVEIEPIALSRVQGVCRGGRGPCGE